MATIQDGNDFIVFMYDQCKIFTFHRKQELILLPYTIYTISLCTELFKALYIVYRLIH